MQIEYPHAQSRNIKKFQVRTPLIAPSFSSRGFPCLSLIYEEIKYRLYGVCLISASDMAKGLIPTDAMDIGNITILDSGVYESNDKTTFPNVRQESSSNSNWSRSQYHEIIREIDCQTNSIVVNFDQYKSIEEQIESATKDFNNVPSMVSDFLVKPETVEETVNIPKLANYIQDLRQFDIIGVTADEIGNSFLQRCSAVVMLRNILTSEGLDTPIHVFGAISPYEVFAYFFCGADIFDGLTWLRHAYRKQGLITMKEAATEEMKWNILDHDLHINEWTNNLRFLHHMQEAMRRYSETGDMESLSKEFPIASTVAYIAEIAGAEIHQGGNHNGR